MIKFFVAVLALLISNAAKAEVLTGSIVDFPESDPPVSLGDGLHSVSLSWSVNQPDRSGWFYRSYNTEVALAVGVTSIDQIVDAGSYSFTGPGVSYIGPVFDIGYTGGPNSFLVLRNNQDGYFGVVRTDDVFRYDTPIDHGTWTQPSGLNATWWFQTDGSGNFAPIPEPTGLSFLGLAPLALVMVWRGR